ncbi:MAG: hypothetical protein HYV28_02005 [Ignavibacteriales bacterium]|nr:hypothetical protein [Ignavibacteriales bacterium]
MRGLAVGVYFFIVNVIGYGIAPPLYGKINDMLQIAVNPAAMKTTLLLSPLALLIAGTILYLGSRKLDVE